METEYEHDGFTYQIKKVGLEDALETLEMLGEIGFFEDTFRALTSHKDAWHKIRRKLFGANVSVLNQQGHFVPLSKEATDAHFSGRVGAYYNVLMRVVKYNFEDFLGDGWTTGLGLPKSEAESEPQSSIGSSGDLS